MPNYFESIPKANRKLQFPGGDISPESAAMARRLLGSLMCGDEREQLQSLRKLRLKEVNQWKKIPRQEIVCDQYNTLIETWSDTLYPGIQDALNTAKIGLYSTLAFVKASRMLPVNFDSFAEEVNVMKNYDDETIAILGFEAWIAMERSHPSTYKVLIPFLHHLEELYDIDDDSMVSLLRTSSSIPYIFASATRMTGYFRTSGHQAVSRFLSEQGQ